MDCSWHWDRFCSINTICDTLCPKSRAPPVFHAPTSCDITSAFRGKGKVSAWKDWQAEELTETLIYLASHPFAEHFQRLEGMVVVLYDRKSSLNSVNDAREELFCGYKFVWVVFYPYKYHPHKMDCFNALCTKLEWEHMLDRPQEKALNTLLFSGNFLYV